MSARSTLDTAPLVSAIRFSDGLPKPAERLEQKLSAWTARNGIGRLVKKEPHCERPSYLLPAVFTFHEGSHGSGGIITIVAMRYALIGIADRPSA